MTSALEALMPVQEAYNRLWRIVVLSVSADMEQRRTGRAGPCTLEYFRTRRPLAGPKGRLP